MNDHHDPVSRAADVNRHGSCPTVPDGVPHRFQKNACDVGWKRDALKVAFVRAAKDQWNAGKGRAALVPSSALNVERRLGPSGHTPRILARRCEQEMTPRAGAIS
jgi:hypothetical protein